MPDDYYINLALIALDDYAVTLAETQLIPSRQFLKDDIDGRFAKLRAQGVKDLAGLVAALKTPAKIQSLAAASGLDAEYLTVLKREIASWAPKPVDLKDFPGVDANVVAALEKLGAKNTKSLFPLVKTKTARAELAAKTGIAPEKILELAKLTDVCRIQWVGAMFARLLVEVGCDSVAKSAQADYRELHAEIVKLNSEKEYFKGNIGIEDMKKFVQAAKRVPQAMEF